MFSLAIFIGVYSYLVFFLGITGFLTKANVAIVTLIYWGVILFVKRKLLKRFYHRISKTRFVFKITFKSPTSLFILLFVIQALVNLVGALGPELAFDALWYHLTLPKLYLLNHAIYHIPGGLLYYSDMPKLGEMLYVGALSFGNEIFVKLIHFTFGILVSVVLYKVSHKFFNQIVSLLVVVIFYSNLVVDWELITAYIDLIRTFFELLALWGFINWYESKRNKRLVICGIMIGLAISTKVLAFGSFIILLSLIAFFLLQKKSLMKLFAGCLIYTTFSLLIPLLWFIFSYVNTGNPVYPFFTQLYEVNSNSPNPLQIIPDLWNLFIHSADPISPIYLIFLPLLFVFYAKLQKEVKIIVWYCGLSLLLWYFTPRTGGGRFILPYLPAFSIVCGAIYAEILKKGEMHWKFVSKLLLVVICFIALISISYRSLANKRYIPFIFGQESKQVFLTKQLNFQFGDFIDTDGYFSKNITSTDMVLLYGFHNLYYVDFTFIDSSWVSKGDRFDYIATQKTSLPTRFRNWQLVYSSDKTMVKLYKNKKSKWNIY